MLNSVLGQSQIQLPIVFDNRRVLHARNAFDLKAGRRHLQGCYIDRDELLSRIRVLERNRL